MHRVVVRLCFLWICATCPSPATAGPSGALISAPQAHWPAARAGLVDGDVLQGWQAGDGVQSALLPPTGAITGAFDVLALETLQGDLGALLLSGHRGQQSHQWRVRSGALGAEVRPLVSASAADQVDQALAELTAGRVDPACQALRGLAAGWLAQGRSADALWGHWRCLDGLIAAKREREAEQGLAALIAAPAGDDADLRNRMVLVLRLGFSAADASLWKLSESILVQMPLPVDQAARQEALALRVLMRSTAALYEGRYSAVLALQDSLGAAPTWQATTLRGARALDQYGWAQLRDGQEHAGVAAIQRALRLARRLDDSGADAARFASHAGLALAQTGDLAAAEFAIRRALAVVECLHPDGQRLASTLNNLALVMASRGNLAEAEQTYQRALQINQRLDPQGISAVRTIYNLASLELQRGNTAAAEHWAKLGVPILDGQSIQGEMPGHSYVLLGSIAYGRGDLAQAERWFLRSRDAFLRLGPDNSSLAQPLVNLGELARHRRQWDAARLYALQALGIRLRAEPGSAATAESWHQLGDLDLRTKRPAQALLVLRLAQNIQVQRVPESLPYARTLNAMGRAHLALGHPDQARALLCEAVDVLDRSRPQISTSPTAQSETLAHYQHIREDCIAQEVRGGHPDRAFEQLERGRGLALRALLAQRDLAYKAELPEALRSRWRQLEQALDAARAQQANAVTTAQAQAAQEARSDLERQRELLIAQIRLQAPRFAELQFPRSLSSADVRKRLTPDTALIAWSVGRRHSYAFVIRADQSAVLVHELPLREARAERQINELSTNLDAAQKLSATLQADLRHWHQALIEPLQADLQGVTRLVLVPDAELLPLPFAGLIDRDGHYAFERHAMLISDSATLWATGDEQTAQPAKLVAVANNGANRTDRPVVTLPNVRREVEAIGALFRSRVVFDERSGTEAAVRRSSGSASVLHFATHSLYDPVTPLDSGLLLGADSRHPGAQGDGLLQAWEIFDAWRLRADLVTLSACATGRGKVLAGEGLIGLTRAFQYAGARTVLASLWSISDRATADLMTEFYRELELGQPADLALQRAQIRQLRVARRTSAELSVRRGVGGLRYVKHQKDDQDLSLLAFQLYGSRERRAALHAAQQP